MVTHHLYVPNWSGGWTNDKGERCHFRPLPCISSLFGDIIR